MDQVEPHPERIEPPADWPESEVDYLRFLENHQLLRWSEVRLRASTLWLELRADDPARTGEGPPPELHDVREELEALEWLPPTMWW